MAGFTEAVLQRKLDDLNESQQSIQTLSLWLIHHRKHHQLIIKTWAKEMSKGSEVQKLTLMYLANDVIQNSKKKGPEYTKEFIPVLMRAFQIIGSMATSPRTRQKLDRILQIWEERLVYDKKTVEEFRKIFHQNDDGDNNSPEIRSAKKRKNSVLDTSSNGSKDALDQSLPMSPTYLAANDPPDLEELQKALQDLETAASVDVAVREKISKLPPEVSEVKLLAKIEDKEQAMKLAERVNDAVELLQDYNQRLLQELEERKKVTQMLRDYAISQKQLLQQAENRLEEYKEKLIKVEQVRHEVVSHLSNLPDLKQLPDVTSGLAPLPAANDLFI
ncbi:DUF618 [Nesidiocoris tenuis]|uniref:DUF618 n=1 Tax=Nesidiocoris tenuis TaxID=355587 RepID=A0ABN7BEZ2_9HEMI|nr:DUF618 [Nesidiocoris tenuis]